MGLGIMHLTDDLRLKDIKVVMPPAALVQELQLTQRASVTVRDARAAIANILHGREDRVLVVVGPCSIHDSRAAREYGRLLRSAVEQYANELVIVMRVYLEKPRTIWGWKGLINDPGLDQSFRINDGLRMARQLLIDLAEMGVPAGTEFLEVMTPQYLVDLVSWGAIGARTSESQIHRQLVSGLSCPVGFKNGTSGDVEIAIHAVLSAAQPHSFLAQAKSGRSAIFVTTGNSDCHVVLRGGRSNTNYSPDWVANASGCLEYAGLGPRVMVDCSHGNSGKDHKKQPLVCHAVAAQIEAGEERIMGVMLESNLVGGAQQPGPREHLTYGQSITDSCMGWEETLPLLRELSKAASSRRLRKMKSKLCATGSGRGEASRISASANECS
jgi:3-deoxy-7-phosphoheptulonate synthase